MSITLIDLHPPQADLQRLVQDGLQRNPRQLPAWMLYDAEGSRLFSEICRQPEYTLTNREITLLEQHADAIAAVTGPGLVVEFGIGNARKVDPLLTALGSGVFAALDISLSALEEALSGLATRHPNTTMVGICCDHTRLEQLPQHPALQGQRRIGFFPGSSLGNFTPNEAVDFLRNARQLLAGGPLLLGLDQPRDPALMEAAYDDAAGVSAAFASNLLRRLNRDLQGDADPRQFRYRARWQPQEQRIEMALVSTRDQTVHLGGEAWFFRNGEAWITEHSVKYSPEAAAALAARAGWRIERRWEDLHQQIALHLLLPAD
ncbi:methyltransferase [Synechococcus sp. KORDI-52]|uniref:L-histidine N(alpha)-methyltransferase n=1 Tax=Synechococcus sp. KORDI-52 TaxID=585425 RepID=UPI0004E07F5F|nr:L-histidine N(alpha)-methyltransferase [Synechococcus sp. KORDI-52]AII47910.1 methyltransferase [Synechococcus sp. KORDI-52]